MTRLPSILIVLCLFALPRPVVASITNTVEIFRAGHDLGSVGKAFELTATALTAHRPDALSFNVRDAVGAASLGLTRPAADFAPGDLIRIRGVMTLTHERLISPQVHEIEVLRHGPPPVPVDATADDIYSGSLVYSLVRVTGTVLDAFLDETNPHYAFIVLSESHGTVCFSSRSLVGYDLSKIIDAKVALSGVCFNHSATSPRARLGYEVEIVSPEDIKVLVPAPEDPFSVPLLTGNAHEIWRGQSQAPRRRRLLGRVAAVWHGNRILLRTDEKHCSRIELSEPVPPRVDDVVEAVGLPGTDFYQLNLSRAIWRPAPTADAVPNPPPVDVSVKELLTDDNGRRNYNANVIGQTVRLKGLVRTLPAPNGDSRNIELLSDGQTVPIDLSPCPSLLGRIAVGACVRITGVCLLVTEDWRPQASFPHVTGIVIVPRTADDLQIITAAPWWTFGKLCAVIGALLVLIAVILSWNLGLRRLIARKSRALAREQIEHERTRLKTEERTRLAVELHDSVAQSLTGASMELETACALHDSAPQRMMQHLAIADRALKSCRDDLRSCLWDLRSHALDEPDMTRAILRMLTPHVNKARLAVRFNVARTHLSENTAHIILRIVRELTLNAIHHGKASSVHIAGCIDDGRILFSVADDGCGFDPDDCPGVREGHFGLEGVRERINQLSGTVNITSAPGNGTNVKAEFPLPGRERSERT